MLASFSSGSVHCRYKAFCDTWFCKKSIVDTIFRIGHWSKEAADKWELDRTQHPSGAADSRATTKAQIAQQARRDAHYALQRYTKYRYNRALAGICDTCGADTAKQHMHRIKCWVCSRLVCQSEKCRVAEHSLCTGCRPHCSSRLDGDRESLHVRAASILPKRDQPEVCDSCNFEKSDLPGGREHSPAAPVLLSCIECNRWLCKRCRLPQRVGYCITCPAKQNQTDGHWGVSLRAPRSSISWNEVCDKMDRADRLSEEAGTLCKKAGDQQHYHDGSAPEGRGMRISREWRRAEHEADASETETEQSED